MFINYFYNISNDFEGEKITLSLLPSQKVKVAAGFSHAGHLVQASLSTFSILTAIFSFLGCSSTHFLLLQ